MPDDQPVNQEKALRIALLSDTHTVCISPDLDRRLYKGRFDRAIAQVNAANVDLVLIAGDLTNDGKRDEVKAFRSQVKSLSSPVCCVPGNHDVGDKHRAEKPGEGATYAPKLTRDAGRIDWTRDVADIERQVRAFDPWPGTFTTAGGAVLKILSAAIGTGSGTPGEVLDDGLLVDCGDGALRLTRVQLAGRAAMDPEAFLRGHKIARGSRLGT